MQDDFDEMLARKTAVSLGIPTEFVKKDHYVTQAIRLLTGLEDKYFSLVFQGGTSLSKAYRVVDRLSEDIDFRVMQRPAAAGLGKGARRSRLRAFRHALIEALRGAGLAVPDEGIRVLYEGRFMRIKADFSEGGGKSYLRPHILIECFVGDLALEPKKKEVSTLVKRVLSEECQHVPFFVNCVSLDETAAEKWVALTRRVANAEIRPRQSDKHLVRHMYDLYHLSAGRILTGEYAEIVNRIMEKDRQQFKHHNPAYVDDPVAVSAAALTSLSTAGWRAHWEEFMEHMVYEKNKPSFDEAYEQLKILSQEIFSQV